MKIHFRLETPSDYYAVEAMTREAFWRFWESDRQICDEHLLVHKLRQSPAFVPELDFVALLDGRIIGHIIYTKSKVVDDDSKCHETLTFGPLTVLPEHQGRDAGRAIMQHSFDTARHLGYPAIIIFGHPDYYPRIGFRPASEFGISTSDGASFDAFMALPLYDGALDGISGHFFAAEVYEQTTQEQALAFDKQFPSKPPHTHTPIGVLTERLQPTAARVISDLNLPSLDCLRAKSVRELSQTEGIDADAIKTIRLVMREQGYNWGRA